MIIKAFCSVRKWPRLSVVKSMERYFLTKKKNFKLTFPNILDPDPSKWKVDRDPDPYQLSWIRITQPFRLWNIILRLTLLNGRWAWNYPNFLPYPCSKKMNKKKCIVKGTVSRQKFSN